jgi:hypothetical protein
MSSKELSAVPFRIPSYAAYRRNFGSDGAQPASSDRELCLLPVHPGFNP